MDPTGLGPIGNTVIIIGLLATLVVLIRAYRNRP
jgi:hypothetical protein